MFVLCDCDLSSCHNTNWPDFRPIQVKKEAMEIDHDRTMTGRNGPARP
jgi:hypothetical protein